MKITLGILLALAVLFILWRMGRATFPRMRQHREPLTSGTNSFVWKKQPPDAIGQAAEAAHRS